MPKVNARPEVCAFAELMESRLKANDHKGGWTDCSPVWLLNRLIDEGYELTDALADGRYDDAAKEAADIANFAMMICDVISEQTGELDATTT